MFALFTQQIRLFKVGNFLLHIPIHDGKSISSKYWDDEIGWFMNEKWFYFSRTTFSFNIIQRRSVAVSRRGTNKVFHILDACVTITLLWLVVCVVFCVWSRYKQVNHSTLSFRSIKIHNLLTDGYISITEAEVQKYRVRHDYLRI